MSQMSATARPLRVSSHVPSRAPFQVPARGPRRGNGKPPLRVIPSRIRTTGNGGFAAACIALLTLGLVALLLLNTALAQGSIALGQLQRESTALSDSASNLKEQIEASSASGALALKASQLGMVRANERAYIDLAKGTVAGTAYPATRLQAFPIVTSPTPTPEAAKKVASAGTSATLAAEKVAASAAAAAAAKPTTAATKPPAAAATKPTTAATKPAATKPAATPAATPKTAGAAAVATPAATLGTTSRTGKPAATQPKPTTTAAPR